MITSLQWRNRMRRFASLQQPPVLQEFFLVKLGPRLHESLFTPLKAALQALDGIDGDDRVEPFGFRATPDVPFSTRIADVSEDEFEARKSEQGCPPTE